MFSGWALRNVMDNMFRTGKPGLKVYLRTSNAPIDDEDSGVGEEDEFATYGFQACVTGGTASGELTGYTDQLIQPPPDVEPMSMHDIGLSGGKLFLGAHSFIISHTWVKNEMNRMGISDPYQIFRHNSIVGIIYNGRLFSIEMVNEYAAHGEVISWHVVGNFLETAQTEGDCC